jgi:hypothetical protein
LRCEPDLKPPATIIHRELTSMKLLTLLSLLTVLALPVESSAQAGPGNAGAAGRQEPGVGILTRDTLSPSDVKRIAEQIDQWKRVERNGSVAPRVAKSRATAMLAALKVSCGVSDATYRGTAPNDTQQHIYEAACDDGMGYLLILQHSELTGISCLEAGRDGSPVKCALPANSDSKLMAGSVLTRNHIPCTVRDVKWLGTSAANLDHTEVVCEGDTSHVLRRPRPGSVGELAVVSCQDAIKQGVACELSPLVPSVTAPIADFRPTLSWFKEALSQNGVSCLTKRARIVGRESIKRRYLVEFECSDRPEGLVAFVPPAGDTANSFESMSCPSAAERGIRCELSVKPN